jgi:hypothetical protein
MNKPRVVRIVGDNDVSSVWFLDDGSCVICGEKAAVLCKDGKALQKWWKEEINCYNIIYVDQGASRKIRKILLQNHGQIYGVNITNQEAPYTEVPGEEFGQKCDIFLAHHNYGKPNGCQFGYSEPLAADEVAFIEKFRSGMLAK